MANLREEYRERMQAADEDHVLVYWSGPKLERVIEQVTQLCKIAIEHGYTLVPWLHPDLPCRESLLFFIEGAFEAALHNLFLVNPEDEKLTDEGLMHAADAVLGEIDDERMWQAALLGTLPVFFLWPDRPTVGSYDNGCVRVVDEAIARATMSPEDLAELLADLLRSGADPLQPSYDRIDLSRRAQIALKLTGPSAI